MATEVVEKQFIDKQIGEQTYWLYLPKDYDNGQQRYRTLYHLHGMNAPKRFVREDVKIIAEKMENTAVTSYLDPMIIVAPFDPQGDSMWCDRFDGRFPIWTAFTQELIPHIDATYRTIPAQNGRALQGFSMGGFGTAVTARVAPHLFSSYTIWDGALHNWDTLKTNRRYIAQKVFGSANYFEQWSPWPSQPNTDVNLMMVVGMLKAYNGRFHHHLTNIGQQHTYIDTPHRHDLFALMNHSHKAVLTFIANCSVNPQLNFVPRIKPCHNNKPTCQVPF